jgi:hypothetical protein
VTAQPAERWGYFAIGCIWIAGLAFSKRLEPLLMIAFESIQRNASALVNSTLLLALSVLIAFATGLIGSIGQGEIKPSGLGTAIIWHGFIGLLVALSPFFLGGGFLGLLRKTASQSTAVRILGGFPLGLFLAFLSAASLISMKFGWVFAVMILFAAIAGWSRLIANYDLTARYLKLVAMVFPFGLLLAGRRSIGMDLSMARMGTLPAIWFFTAQACNCYPLMACLYGNLRWKAKQQARGRSSISCFQYLVQVFRSSYL